MLYLLLFFHLGESALYPNERCMSDDCSNQLLANVGSCIIYNTSICSQTLNELYPASFKDLTSEDNSRFEVLVVPYEAEYVDNKSPLKLDYYAVNISSIFEKGISQVAIKLTEETLLTRCRLFDFRSYASNTSFPVNLFYDCFHKFKSKFKFHLEVMSFSTMEKLSYDVIIPSYKNLRNVCDWKPSVVIFTGSLDYGIVSLKFSQVPSWLNVSYYLVKFIPKTKAEMETNFQIPSDQNRSMLLVKFHPGFSDTFTILISPLNVENKICLDAEKVVIQVGFSKYGIEITIVFYFCVALLGIGVLIFLKCLYNYLYLFESAFKPHLLLIHAINYPEEKRLASAFSEYLSVQHGCKVSSIYGDGLDPVTWCAEKYRECNVIIVIISEGLFLTLDSEHFKPLKVFHSYCKQPIIADNILSDQKCQPNSDFRKKKIAKVCFPYSSQNHIPDSMKFMGRCFMLPKELSSFYCFLFGCKPVIRCIKHSLTSTFSKIKISNEYKELMAAVEAVQLAIERGLDSPENNPNKTRSSCEVQSEVMDDTNSLTKSDSDADLGEYDPLIIIRKILQGSSDLADDSENPSDLADDSGNRSSLRGSVKDVNAPELIELMNNYEVETDSIMQQMVNLSMGWEDPNLTDIPEYSSMLDQIVDTPANVIGLCEDSESKGF